MPVAALSEDEINEVVKKYRQLLRSCRRTMKEGDKKLIRKAFDLALDAHKNTRRKSGEPYIFHPIAVAQICVDEIGLGTTSVICALLHDVVEDTDITLDVIQRQFGDKVGSIIDGLTKMANVFDHTTNSLQAENFRKMLLTLSDDVRVILIKLADRLHNMRTLDSMSRNGQLKISSETLYLYAPLAHRLGLYAIKSELEDLGIKYTETEKYNEILQKLKDTKPQRTRYINQFIEPIANELKRQGMNVEIKGRPKSIFSILSKMKKQGIPFEEVYDLFAIRIITESPPENEKADCWNVYSVVTDIYYPNPARLRDWISSPKSNGYESLHTTVMGPKGRWVEVQIRSRRMDDIAEKGYAAHWKYKDSEQGTASESGLEDWLTQIREILESPDSNAIDFLDDFKLNLYADEVFIFTPKGELKQLPANSTALDFAFEVHSEVGLRCLGAKVNGKLVPLSHVLQNGDQVEVITSKKQKPNEEWLKFVVTGKAKSRIKQALKDEKRRISQEGKEYLERKFRNAKITWNKDSLNQLVNFYKLPSSLDLFYAIATGLFDKSKLDLDLVFHKPATARDFSKMVEPKVITAPAAQSPTPAITGKALKPGEKTSDIIILGDNLTGVEYSFSKCCNPIPGDDVFGFITVSDGIKIHRTNCPNGIKLMSNYGYRVIKAQWANSPVKQDKYFLAGIHITGIDSVGVISKITDIVSKELEVNMKSITVESNEGTFDGDIMVYIMDTSHLDVLMKKIELAIPFISVKRIELNQEMGSGI